MFSNGSWFDASYFRLEQQLLQVIGRVNDEQSAETGSSSVSSDNIDDIAGAHDQSSSIFYDDDHYPPTVDKSRKWRYKIGINLFNRFVKFVIFCRGLFTGSYSHKICFTFFM